MIKGLFRNVMLISALVLPYTQYSFADEYSPNAFKMPPDSNTEQAKLQRGFNNQTPGQPPQMQGLSNQMINNPTSDLSNVNKTLTEKEERSQKILEEVNKKMAKAKNVPVENARYIGIINGKRVYQDNTTNEYIKVELDK